MKAGTSGRRRRAGFLSAVVAIVALAVAPAASARSEATGNAFVSVVPSVPASIDPGNYQGRPSSDIGTIWASPLMRWKAPPANAKTLPGPFQLEPYLAQSVKKLPNGSLQFTLRNAKSPYGNTVTSQDVKWSFERMLAIDFVARALITVGNIDLKEPIQVVNDRTFNVHVTDASSLTLAALGWYSVAILDSTEAKKHATSSDPWARAWLDNHSATFGPYQIDGFQPGQTVSFSLNPNYFGPKPYYTRGVIRAIPEAGSRLQLVKSGQATHTRYLDYSQFADAAKDKKLTAIQGLSANQDVIALNNRTKPFNDARVRTALAEAIDRTALVKAIYHGFAKASGFQVTSAVPQPWKPAPMKYNPTDARKLLAEAGYPNGFEFTAATNTALPGNYVGDLAQLIQSQLAKVGVKMNIAPIASSTEFEANQRNGKVYQAVFRSFRPAMVDPAYAMFAFMYTTGPVVYPVGYSNPKLDKIVNLMLHTEPGKRHDRYVISGLKLIAQDVPWTTLVETVDQHILPAGIKGYAPLPFGELYLDRLSIEK